MTNSINNDKFTPKRHAPYLLYDELIKSKKLHNDIQNIILVTVRSITHGNCAL